MGAHRLASRATLRAQVKRLEAEAADLACQVVKVTGEFDAAAVELSGALEDRRAADERAKHLAGQLAEAMAEVHRLRAELAESGAVTVPPAERDTSHPADIATHPIPAGDMWADPTRWRHTA
ncbi:hypothetical protein [Streptomyces qinglanensis]|uniref:Uncharacterized protein n=1 Tax=Streptomyces qinglanensis TaxID=943816 RepID=A0A1H9U4H8_9ACTN|nr:hypothetical protein [Streptomyces qinglanensis]SES04279.1 hypothetical protein SAMN05421870_107318 [Streptomyces qinglanensis]